MNITIFSGRSGGHLRAAEKVTFDAARDMLSVRAEGLVCLPREDLAHVTDMAFLQSGFVICYVSGFLQPKSMLLLSLP